MFTYVCLGTNDLHRAAVFYDAALGALGLQRCDLGADSGPEEMIGWGTYLDDRSKRIVLLPSKVDSPQFASGGSVVNRQLYAQLQRANYKVALLDEKNYVETWGQEVAAVGGIYDPHSGWFRPDAYARALSSLVKRITAEVDCSMVLAPRFVLQSAKVSHSSASWDGVTRAEHEKDEVLMSNLKYEYDGTAAGLSLELMAFNDKGEWSSRRMAEFSSLPKRCKEEERRAA